MATAGAEKTAQGSRRPSASAASPTKRDAKSGVDKWIAENIPNQAGKTAVVTGANSGIGFEVTKELARAGANVVMGCRNLSKGEDAKADIVREVPDASLEVIQLDLSDLSSVRSFAKTFRSSHDRLDILCNNAGIMAIPRRMVTVDGFEMQLGTNYFGHFALTGLLLDLVLAVEGRVVTMAAPHMDSRATMDFGNLQWQKGSYGPTKAYARSKLAGLLFTYELSRRLERSGSRTRALAAHPGYSRTNLQSTGANSSKKTITSRLTRFAINIMRPIMAQSPRMGALPMLFAATSPNVQSGEYYGARGFLEARGYPKKVKSGKLSYDESVAKELWEVSEKLTGVSFPFESAKLAKKQIDAR